MVAIRSARTQVAKTLRGVDLTGLRVRRVDAENQIVGCLASQLSIILQGKDKPTYLPSRDNGDACVVVNASKVAFTGDTWQRKRYLWHTGYPGGLKERTVREVYARKPEDILWRAVNGMLPKNKLREARLRKLVIFPGWHDLEDIEMFPWEMPQRVVKITKRLQGKQAPFKKR